MIKRAVTAKNLGLAAAVLACLGVFMLYTRPEFLITLADQIWACF
jgi:hypothetical protein